jgi:hypothetical protein
LSGEDVKHEGDFAMEKDDFVEKTVEEQLGENIAKDVREEVKKKRKHIFDLVKGIFTQLTSTKTKQLSYEKVRKRIHSMKKRRAKT